MKNPAGVISMSGSGFSPRELVDIYLDTNQLALAATNAKSAFSLGSIRIPAATSPGLHWITAVARKTHRAVQQPLIVTTDWSHRRFDNNGSGHNPFENTLSTGNVARLGQRWATRFNYDVNYGAAAAQGVLFVTALDTINALNPKTGARLWARSIDGGTFSSPVLGGGLVFVSSVAGRVEAYNAKTGALKWKSAKFGDSGIGATPTYANGKVYVSTFEGGFAAIDAKTGEYDWMTIIDPAWTAGRYNVSAATYALGSIYIGNTAGDLVAIDASNGSSRWTYSTNHSAISDQPVFSNGRIFFSSDQNIYCVDDEGGLIWTKTAADSIVTSMTISGTSIFYIDYSGNIAALNVDSGAVRWTRATGIASDAGISSANGVVYANQSGKISALSEATGELLWSAVGGIPYDAAPLVSDGMLFVGGRGRTLRAFAIDSGAHLAAQERLASRPPDVNSLRPTLAVDAPASVGSD